MQQGMGSLVNDDEFGASSTDGDHSVHSNQGGATMELDDVQDDVQGLLDESDEDLGDDNEEGEEGKEGAMDDDDDEGGEAEEMDDGEGSEVGEEDDSLGLMEDEEGEEGEEDEEDEEDEVEEDHKEGGEAWHATRIVACTDPYRAHCIHVTLYLQAVAIGVANDEEFAAAARGPVEQQAGGRSESGEPLPQQGRQGQVGRSRRVRGADDDEFETVARWRLAPSPTASECSGPSRQRRRPPPPC